jgi:Tol biopolymer transport system component
VRLGDGIAQDLSPDGKWAIALPVASPDHVLLLPTGPGETKSLDTGGVTCHNAMWLPDGGRILISGSRKGEPNRIFVMPISGGAARPLTPGGTTLASPVSPDGRYIPVWQPGHVMTLLPTDGSSEEPRTLTGIAADENPQGWDSTGRYLYLVKGTTILRMEVATGRKELWKDIDLADSAEGGQIDSDTVHLTPDGRFCVYGRFHSDSALYLVTGLR